MAIAKISMGFALISITGLIVCMQVEAEDYKQATLKKHNNYRKPHQAPAMKLDSGLSELAAQCAKYYMKKGKIDHTCTIKGTAGENLYMSKRLDPGTDLTKQAENACKYWYDEIVDYNYDHPDKSTPGKMVGHFTQLVWKKSNKLGVGHVLEDDKCVIVALYQPPGNVVVSGGTDAYEKYRKNVLRIKKSKGSQKPVEEKETPGGDSAPAPKHSLDLAVAGLTFATVLLARCIRSIL